MGYNWENMHYESILSTALNNSSGCYLAQVSFWVDENILKSVMMFVQLVIYLKTTELYTFKGGLYGM